jgi:NADP-dependent 3-hydroxy acid dehydrogenase YdfG
MTTESTILLTGTGAFAARILFDIAATAAAPTRVVLAGRNRERLQWLKVAAGARAAIFGTPVTVVARETDLLAEGAASEMLEETMPNVVVQAASVQTSSVIAGSGDAWSRLVAEGGLSATAVFQALLSTRVAVAMTRLGSTAPLINCSFPDVVNGLIKALGHQVTCGMGNVAILSSVFAADRGLTDRARIKVLAHYQNLEAWRRPAETRSGPQPRVWIDDEEIADVFGTFRDVKLTPEPVIDISGASGVPMILALAEGRLWAGHVPGPYGLPGGYPVQLTDGALSLNLPSSISRAEAVAWNARFEEENGLIVGADRRARYTGVLRERLAQHSPALAEGFDVADLEEVHRSMQELRTRLQQPG